MRIVDLFGSRVRDMEKLTAEQIMEEIEAEQQAAEEADCKKSVLDFLVPIMLAKINGDNRPTKEEMEIPVEDILEEYDRALCVEEIMEG
jgi:hypothetical protein